MWDSFLGRINIADHRIVFLSSDTAPAHSGPYCAGPKTWKFEKTELEKMLAENIIEPAQNEWTVLIMFVPGMEGTLWFCVDSRKLNALTNRDLYAIPRMDECIKSLNEATVFNTLDTNSKKWQIEIKDKDKSKTGATLQHGIYRFIRMPFALCNAPRTFQRTLDVNLSSVMWQFAFIYLDDIVVFSRTP